MHHTKPLVRIGRASNASSRRLLSSTPISFMNLDARYNRTSRKRRQFSLAYGNIYRPCGHLQRAGGRPTTGSCTSPNLFLVGLSVSSFGPKRSKISGRLFSGVETLGFSHHKRPSCPDPSMTELRMFLSNTFTYSGRVPRNTSSGEFVRTSTPSAIRKLNFANGR